ncbi:hypothetical protein ARTHRO9AX_30205 [Arthrobacter sp. 9AX]|uniref:hypothetical protein n=1 Tax=Arthrobacter sp. 9AX TaxID=2653131 RepID=UPI0012F3B1CB|nr:hypothetical protein [Arthrobacter sp. 9AX]VXC38696.1 hypothetical protein ARTHRO9AX_30205 [Arthrobacter sp. 9AX]
MIDVRKVQALLNEHPHLHRLGYGNPPGKQISDAARAELLTPPARVRIHAALHWIEANLAPATRYQSRPRSAYSWKHEMQRQTGLYVTVGEFAAAALLSHISVDTNFYNPLLHAVHVPAGSQP